MTNSITSFHTYHKAQPRPVQDIVESSMLDMSEEELASFAGHMAQAKDISIFGDGSGKDG